ncbi:Hypothetical protein ORPV_424 [Orpheovirus IHUMI-LCC2]|uniref:MORN-repeat protein n=1 Tax=Orpheovirus IHUMI-LCC2 TaxID=2023057 RepID=A0A2I2L476_9VIRU|nr:Hypothetical protein ORPV_424 [Orpheovirus IHUMI-LCC2]SNW62328.1 Hypothetical protein ORPV_424 [Orpheovirus IHUMI-LCC2]
MNTITDDILFYQICYHDYETSILFSLLCKSFYKLSRGYGNDIRTPLSPLAISVSCRDLCKRKRNYFLEYVDKVSKYGNITKYWKNRFTNRKEGLCRRFHEIGNKWIECYYQDGKLEGKYQEWYDNGYIQILC